MIEEFVDDNVDVTKYNMGERSNLRRPGRTADRVLAETAMESTMDMSMSTLKRLAWFLYSRRFAALMTLLSSFF